MSQSTTSGIAVPNASAPALRRYRQVAVRVCCAAAFLRGRSASLCQGQRSATRWRRNPLAGPSNALRKVRCQVHPPSEGRWSAEHIRRWRGGFDLARRLGRRSPGAASLAPSPLVRVNRPARSRLARLPIDAFQNIARCACSEFIDTGADVNANAIHRFHHIVGRVACQVFPDRIAKKLAAGPFGAPGQPLRAFEDIVWNRYRCFHTKSITRFRNGINLIKAQDVCNNLPLQKIHWRFLNFFY